MIRRSVSATSASILRSLGRWANMHQPVSVRAALITSSISVCQVKDQKPNQVRITAPLIESLKDGQNRGRFATLGERRAPSDPEQGR